jgi:hypothetical protein
MDIFLVVVSIIVGVFGFFSLSQATMGIGIICGACLLGILARIAQASKHQEELINEIAALKQPKSEN